MTPTSARYPYRGADPPAPYVLLNLAHSTGPEILRDIPALADTGADSTVLPSKLLASLRVPEFGAMTVRSYDDRQDSLKTYIVRLQIRDLPVIELEVIGSDFISTAIVGRDVLNRYDIRLDGPNRVMLVSDT